MTNLKKANKVTRATLKSFIKRNLGKVYVRQNSTFDGMTDCVESVDSKEVLINEINLSDATTFGIDGLRLVGESRDSLKKIDNGISVYNCCGSCEIFVK